MNLKSFEKRKVIKNKTENMIIKSLAFILKPLFKTIDWYKETQFYENNEVKKYTKKVYRNIYKDISHYESIFLTDKYIHEDDLSGNIISFDNSWMFYDAWKLRDLRGISPSELLREVIDVLNNDSNITISKEDTKNIFKWGYDEYGEYFYKVEKL